MGASSLSGSRLMVLGAGIYQLAGIRRAVELGCEVITVDNVPGNVGHRLSHGSVDVSTTDVAGVVHAARQRDVGGVVTFASDVATATVAAVASDLSLPGLPPDRVRTATDKADFRAFQSCVGLDAPDHVRVDADIDVNEAARTWTGPAIVKPVDSSGSRGVSRVASSAQWRGAIDTARQYSRRGDVCIEEVVPGVEVGGDVYLVAGQVAAGMVTNKHRRGFVVIGHSVPSVLPVSRQQAVLDVVAETCRRLEILDGAVNFDVMIDGERIVVLELSPRTGGNGIPELILHATGFDGYEATIRTALGRDVAVSPRAQVRPCGSAVYGSPVAGTIKHLRAPVQLGHPARQVLAFYCGAEPGDAVPAFRHGGSSLGYVVFSCRSEADYEAVLDNIADLIDLDVRMQ